jgi:2-oxo-4-hydroxy-4-carboxy-5-ureidoimidazoline decarboxylase
VTVAELNALDREAFVNALGWICEDSPWVAERSHPRGPFADRECLHRVMADIVSAASRFEQLALLCAHPDLGAKAQMSDASVGEQAGAGLDRLTEDEYRRLTEGTRQYRERFGFPFLLAVTGRSAQDVIESLERRLTRDPLVEWDEALVQVSAIARLRLPAVVD